MIQRLALAFLLVAFLAARAPAKDPPPPAPEASEVLSESEDASDTETPTDSENATEAEAPTEAESAAEEETATQDETATKAEGPAEAETATKAESAAASESPPEPKWEVTFAGSLEKRKGQTVYQAPIVEISYHLRDDLLLDFIAPWTVLSPNNTRSKNGIGNMQTGVQWQFLDEESFAFSALVFPRIEFNTPGSSSLRRGLVEEGMKLSLPLQVGKTLGPVGFALEAGYSFIEHRIDQSFYSVAAVYGVSQRLELVSQFLGAADTDFGAGDAAFLLGFRWWLSDHVALVGSAGKGIYDSQGDAPQLISSFGIQYSF